MQEDWDYVDDLAKLFKSRGDTVFFVGLEADVVERLERNKSGKA